MTEEQVVWPAVRSRSGQVPGFDWVCAGCRQDRDPGDPFVFGPDPTGSYAPLLWDTDCLRCFVWRFPR